MFIQMSKCFGSRSKPKFRTILNLFFKFYFSMNYVWRLQKYWPPTPSHPASVSSPPHQRWGVHTWRWGGWGVNIFEDARHSSVLYVCKYFGLLQSRAKQSMMGVGERATGRINFLGIFNSQQELHRASESVYVWENAQQKYKKLDNSHQNLCQKQLWKIRKPVTSVRPSHPSFWLCHPFKLKYLHKTSPVPYFW